MPRPPRTGEGVNTSRSGLSAGGELPASSQPARIAIRPSASSAWVGYHRPLRIAGCSVHFSVQGSNVNARSSPLKSLIVEPSLAYTG